MANATDKQIRYALMLMARAGYPVEWMNSAHTDLGAGMRERSGRVEAWLKGMNAGRISLLIDALLKKQPVGEAVK